VPDRSNVDFIDDSGGVWRGVGGGEIRENESRRDGRCIFLVTDFSQCAWFGWIEGEMFADQIYICKFTGLSRGNSSFLRQTDSNFVSEDNDGR